MTVGQAIRALRKKRGLTQTQLGALCGISDGTILISTIFLQHPCPLRRAGVPSFIRHAVPAARGGGTENGNPRLRYKKGASRHAEEAARHHPSR